MAALLLGEISTLGGWWEAQALAWPIHPLIATLAGRHQFLPALTHSGWQVKVNVASCVASAPKPDVLANLVDASMPRCLQNSFARSLA